MSPRVPQGPPGSPRFPPGCRMRSSRDKHYINKLPINRKAAVMLMITIIMIMTIIMAMAMAMAKAMAMAMVIF